MTAFAWLKRWFESLPVKKRRGAESAAPDRAGEIADEISDSADEDEIDPFNPFPEPIRVKLEDVIDLHTIAPRDVKRVVEEYLLDARAAGFRSVRLIHGKGRGVQRATVHKILAQTPFVESWTDAPPGGGGWGATVVHLKPKEEG